MLGCGLAGRADGHPLDATGRAQAAALGAAFAGCTLAAVVSSPRLRTMQTAAGLGRPVVAEPGFDEIDFGAWTGMAFTALAVDPHWQAWNRARTATRCPGGETMLEAQARAVSALWRLPGGESVVVSHSDIIKAVLGHVLGAPLDFIHRIDIAPASRSTVTLFEFDARVDAVNLPPPG